MTDKKHDTFFVYFKATDQRFPIRYMQTSDQYEVELPCGVYGGELLKDLKQELNADFKGVSIVR